ncbi:centromere protein P [Brachionichthys hirsutus]|uniref:centromere protein P n=1 Tax=Brachionichthys hirsutus TaxID=412623 RepID=UPI00360441FB
MSAEDLDGVRELEAHIRRLQTDVTVLQDHLRDLDPPAAMRDAALCVRGQKQEEQEVRSRLKEVLRNLEEDLKVQTKMSGVSLERCSRRSLRSGGGKAVHQLCLSGHCSALAFQVEFQLAEIKEGQTCKQTISDLQVVLDACDLQNLSSFLSRAEENQDLLALIRTLRTVSDRCDDRCRTFRHFQDKYPSVVSLPGGCRSEVMTLNHPELPGCVLSIHWSVNVSKEGGVTPNINLLTKIPLTALQLFPSLAVGGADEAFQSLLRILGPEGALEALIRAINPPQDG